MSFSMALNEIRRPVVRLLTLFGLLAMGGSVTGCVGAAVVAGTGAGMMVAQERSFGDGIDDTKMDIQIHQAMQEQEGADLSRVNTDISEGRVLLTGLVHTPEDRVAAARATWSHPRVKEVINDIQIDSTSQWKRVPKDTWITSRVRTKYLFDSELAGRNYEIEVVNGTVYLFGIAQNQFELEKAVHHARTVNGVKQVVSHVQLRDGQDRQRLVLGQR